jgi:fluoroquinolone transport system permease protein
MATMVQTVRWDLKLQSRSFIYPATVVSTALICGFILVLPVAELSVEWATFFIFMDPAMIGLSFVGAIVLMEKSEGTIFAVGVTPMHPAVYVASKTFTLTLLAFASGLIVAYVAADTVVLWRLVVALALSSTLAVLIGLACVARVPTMNKLMITLLWVEVIILIPVLAHFEVLPEGLTPLVALIPSYAILLAIGLSMDSAPSTISGWTEIYAYGYQLLWCCAGWFWALREYTRNIVSSGG